MFPLRTGHSVDAPDTETVLYQSLTSSAMHEIGKQAILDTSILLFHQYSAEVYHREEKGELSLTDDFENLYSPEELKELRKQLTDVVMRFHIIDENGIISKLTHLINYLKDGVPLEPDYENDPLIKTIIQKSQDYRDNLFNRKYVDTIDKITDFDDVQDNITDDIILKSYSNPDEPLEVAIFEDDTVQCACDFCESFFQVVEKDVIIDDLNPIGKIMAQHFLFENND